MSSGLPEAVDGFIRDHIHSVEQVEVLLLLRREASRPWGAQAVGRELRIAAGSAGERLCDLCDRGLLAREHAEYRFAPRTPELAAAVAELEAAYAERRVSVINHIFSRPSAKISTFASAFTLRRS